MNRVFQLLLTLAVASAATAATVSRQQARQKAAQFVISQGAQLGTDPATVRGRRVQAADQPLYVFNTADERGFVVVSGDDRTDAILGYTLQGGYDDATVPENLRLWLDQMSAEIEALGSSTAAARAAAPARAVAVHGAIKPLIATTWDQGNYGNTQNSDGVYNISLPKIGSAYPCAGCVAVCGAQIMYYYRWPQSMAAALPGYSSSVSATSKSLPATTFQWDKMKTGYTTADGNSEAAQAVAELMLYAGWAAHMSYGVSGSSASQVTLAGSMVQYMDYDPGWHSVSRNSYSVADWDELIYNELANGRPVIYDGDSDSGGHAFLCDGYDGAGLYHFNWGWGGSYNGYFKLSATNPYGAGKSPGYIFSNSAIIGLQPNTGVTPEDPNANDEWEEPAVEGLVANALSCTLDGTTVATYLQNPNDETCAFGLGLAELHGDATLDVLDKRYEYYKNYSLDSYSYFTGQLTFDLSSYNLPQGRHCIVPVSLLSGEDEWRRCRPAGLWFEVDVDGSGNVTATQHPIDDLRVNRFEMTSPGAPDSWQYMQVSVTNQGDNIEKTLYLYVDGAWPRWSSSMRTLKIAAGSTKEFQLATGGLAAGTHTIQLRDGYGGSVLQEVEVDIRTDLAATAFNIGGSLRFAGTQLPVDVTVESRAGDYTYPLYFFASRSSSKGTRKYIAGAGIPAGGSDDVRFYFTPDAAGTWNLWVTTDESGKDVIGQGSVVIDAAPSGTVTLKLTDWSKTFRPDGVVDYTFTVKNTGTTTNYKGIYVTLYKPLNDGSGYWTSDGYANTPDVTLEPGEETTLTVTFSGLEDGQEYSFDPTYYSTYTATSTTRLNSSFTTHRFTYATPADTPYDFDGDGELTTDDVVLLVNSLIGRQPLSADADVNNDGKVDITDVTRLIEMVMKAAR